MGEKLTLDELIDKLQNNDPSYTHLNLFEASVFTDDALLKIAKALDKNNTLKTFTLGAMASSNCEFEGTEKGIKAITEALKNHPHLSHVSFNFKAYMISDDVLVSFLDILTGNADIKSISLESYIKDEKAWRRINKYLQENKTIENLYIECDDFENKIQHSDEFLTGFSNMLQSKSLKRVDIKYINLQQKGIAYISDILKDLTTLEELTLNNCGITRVDVCSLNRVLNNNPIKKLSLLNNLLGTEGIKELTGSFIALKKLKRLSLGYKELDSEALGFLVTGIIDNHVPIESLHIGSFKVDISSMKHISRLIEASRTLRDLNIPNGNVGEEHIKLMFKLLSDPNRCQLNHFRFGMNQEFSSNFYKNLVEIVGKNENFLRLIPGPTPKDLRREFKKNSIKHKKSQQLFIDGVIALASEYYSNKDNRVFIFNLPLELFLAILLVSGKGTLGMSQENIMQCCLLILRNFDKRRTLIETNEYDLSTVKNRGVMTWWSQSIEQEDRTIKIFRQKTGTLPIEEASSFSKFCNIS